MSIADSDCCKTITFEKTGFFSKTVNDYLDQRPSLEAFYHRYPTIEGFKQQIAQKRNSFSKHSRKVLVEVLTQQYQTLTSSTTNQIVSDKTHQNIALLAQEHTFTITTGHQLNLFTGPLYFLYKILSTINLTEQLSKSYPDENFVPVYWMASEDHDFQEINYFNFKGKKIRWHSEQKGPVGRFSTAGLEEVLAVFSSELNSSINANYLRELFTNAYIQHDSLAAATRYIANQLFTDYGLVVVDADHKDLKQLFSPYVKQELIEQISFSTVSKTISSLANEYKIQVNPREINLFYITDTLRERIVFKEGVFRVHHTDISWSEQEILEHLSEFPERFSPNVLMRPLYQEVILPNLCYIGGGGELAYWFELKDYFDSVDVPFPMLLLRNSVQLVSQKQAAKLSKLSMSWEDLFTNQDKLCTQKALEFAQFNVDFSKYKLILQQQFTALKAASKQTDRSFAGAVAAQEQKQLKGLENLEKRWARAQKRNQSDVIQRIITLQNELLPNGSLEERQRNFSEFFELYGVAFIQKLKKHLDPLQQEFVILKL